MSQPVKKEEKPKIEESTITIEKTNPAQYWLVKVPKELINQLQDDSVTGSSTLGEVTFTHVPKTAPQITFTLSPSISASSGTYDLTNLSKTYTPLASVQTGVVKNKKRLIGEVTRSGSLIADPSTQRLLLRNRVAHESTSKGVIKSTSDAEAKIEKDARAGALDAFNEERERIKKIRQEENKRILLESEFDINDVGSIKTKILNVFDERDGRAFKDILAHLNMDSCTSKEEKVIKNVLKQVARYSTKGKERGMYWLKGEFGGLGGMQGQNEDA
ncbi:hypothetical protein TrVE_jg2863 [Triparma verrucosa]|uniref:TFIIF beta subunit N-terminal domain-containing protein n=1 Tax=Triparma verrucosa TaxID=1606542 RepID=A0A9W7BSC6_9STRA|nr:hypothetical protein TrVE_jg2863 [Triparma verrucosa]